MPTDMETIPPQPTLHHEGGGGDPMRPSGTTMGGTGVGVMARHSTINHCESHSLNKCEMRVPHNVITRDHANVSGLALHLLYNIIATNV